MAETTMKAGPKLLTADMLRAAGACEYDVRKFEQWLISGERGLTDAQSL